MKLVAIKLDIPRPEIKDNLHRPKPLSSIQVKPINVTIPKVTIIPPATRDNQLLGIWFASLQYPTHFEGDAVKPIDLPALANTGTLAVVNLDDVDFFVRTYLTHVNRSSVGERYFTIDRLLELPGERIVISNTGDIVEGLSEVYSRYLTDESKEQEVCPYDPNYPRTIFMFNKHGADIRVFKLNGIGYEFGEVDVPAVVERINDLELFWNVLRMSPVKGIDVPSYLKIHGIEMYDRITDYHKQVLQLHREEQRVPFTYSNDEDLEVLVSLDYHSDSSDKCENLNCKLYHHKDHGLLMSLDDDALALVSLDILLPRHGMGNRPSDYLRPRF